MLERIQRNTSEQNETQSPAKLPEIPLCICRVHDTFQVHAKIAGKERQREEDDRDTREDQDGFVLAVCDYCKFVLFDGTELEELQAYD